MTLNIEKIMKLSLSKTKKVEHDLTDEEIECLSNIFNKILNSEEPEATICYLAGIYNTDISMIKLINKVYYFYLASKEEKMTYVKKTKELNKTKRKEGFIDVSAMISITIFISAIGITLALVLYNLL